MRDRNPGGAPCLVFLLFVSSVSRRGRRPEGWWSRSWYSWSSSSVRIDFFRSVGCFFVFDLVCSCFFFFSSDIFGWFGTDLVWGWRRSRDARKGTGCAPTTAGFSAAPRPLISAPSAIATSASRKIKPPPPRWPWSGPFPLRRRLPRLPHPCPPPPPPHLFPSVRLREQRPDRRPPPWTRLGGRSGAFPAGRRWASWGSPAAAGKPSAGSTATRSATRAPSTTRRSAVTRSRAPTPSSRLTNSARSRPPATSDLLLLPSSPPVAEGPSCCNLWWSLLPLINRVIELPVWIRSNSPVSLYQKFLMWNVNRGSWYRDRPLLFKISKMNDKRGKKDEKEQNRNELVWTESFLCGCCFRVGCELKRIFNLKYLNLIQIN